MKLKKAIGVLMCLVLACTCFAFSGCESKNAKYTVTVTASIDTTVTPNVTMGNVSVDPAQSTHKKNSTVTIKAEEKPGYQFVNWTDENGEVIKIGEFLATATYSFKITSNRVFRANFKKIIKATFELNGGVIAGTTTNSIPTNNNVPVGALELQVLTKTGYRFDGWQLNNGVIYSVPQTGDYVYNVTSQNVKDLNFKAVFTPNTYAPKLTVDGGEDINADNTYVLTYDAVMPTLPDCEDENFAYVWKRGGEPVDYTTWKEVVEDEKTIVFEAEKVAAKTFAFEVEGKLYTYKIAEVDAVKDIKEAIPDGVLDKVVGHEFVGFVLKDSEADAQVYTRIKYDLTDEEKANDEHYENILTENLANGQKATYKAKFEVKSYRLDKDETASEFVEIVAGEGFADKVKYNTTVNFKVNAKKQSANSEKAFEITRVYYIDESGNEVTLNEVEGVYSFNMPASNVAIKVDAVANYTVKFYSNSAPYGKEVDIKPDVTTINVPEVADSITGEFLGWTLEFGLDRRDVSYDGKIKDVEAFWNFVNAQEDKYEIMLYAFWRENEDAEVTFVSKTTLGSNYVIVPSSNSLLTFTLNCNDGLNLYQLFENIGKTASNNFSESDELALLYYNVSRCLDNQNQLYSNTTEITKLYLINSVDKTIVKNSSATIEIRIKDSANNEYTNIGKDITKETLQEIKVDGCTITFTVEG